MMPTIRSATQADEGAAIAAIVVAFAADPVARWTWSEPTQYLAHFPDFVKAFGGRAFAHGSAYVADDFSGTALWLPPGVGPDEEALGAILERTAPAHLQGDIFALLEQMARYHPAEPHWYLPGVDPSRQGRLSSPTPRRYTPLMRSKPRFAGHSIATTRARRPASRPRPPTTRR